MQIKTAAQQVIEDRFGKPWDQVLTELAEAGTLLDAANEMGVSVMTLNRWMQRHGLALVRQQGSRRVVRIAA